MAWGRASLEGVELLEDVGQRRLAFANDFGGSALERLFRWDAIDPALLGELFVAGEIEADERLAGADVFGPGFGGLGAGICFCCCRTLHFGLVWLSLRVRCG